MTDISAIGPKELKPCLQYDTVFALHSCVTTQCMFVNPLSVMRGRIAGLLLHSTTARNEMQITMNEAYVSPSTL